MKAWRITGLCLCCLVLGLLSLLPGVVMAQDEAVELQATYQKLEADWPGASFDFEVNCLYTGETGRYFNLVTTGPEKWTVSVKPQYGEQEIGDIRLEPSGTGSKVRVVAEPDSQPEAGEYQITLEASSDSLKDSITLTAVIRNTYSLILSAAEDYRLNTSATAGKDNYYAIVVQNTGSGLQENIKLSSSKPSNWKVEFTPDTIGNLTSGSFQTIDVNIIPDPKAVAGDYEITLAANSEQTTEKLKIRVTVETPTVWGWVGIAIIVVVVAGVIFIFMRFSRR